MSEKILIIEDDIDFQETIKESFEKNFEVFSARSLKEAREIIYKSMFSVVILDLILPDGNGMELLKEIKENFPFTEVIVLTGYGTIKDAIEAVKVGAFNFLQKPIRLEELNLVVDKAIKNHHINKETYTLKRQLGRFYPDFIVMEDEKTKEVFSLARKIKDTATPVLIIGETGTGKELLARYIHLSSPQRKNSFLVIDCSLLQKELLSSELFGHEKGSFTNAYTRKQGLVEIANNGTLFLDEISEMDFDLQAKFLRFLETGSFRRIGGLIDISVNVRIIAATNKDLGKMVEEGRFRKDLYFRLNIFPIIIPPLRERQKDIIPLAENFLKSFGKKGLTERAKEKLLNYTWPGNVRELKNIIERACILAENSFIAEEYLQLDVPKETKKLEEVERDYIMDCLKKFEGDKKKCAEYLGISLRTLYRKLKGIKK